MISNVRRYSTSTLDSAAENISVRAFVLLASYSYEAIGCIAKYV